MDLTIVIVNWNGGRLLMRCLESIRVHAGSSGVEVIVVDNASTDGSRESAEKAFPEFRVIDSGANLGFGRANNLARNLVKTSMVLFLNPDAELLEGSLDRAVCCLAEHPDAAALGCRMIHADGSTQALGLQWPLTPWTVLVEFLLAGDRVRHRLRRWLPTADPHRSGYVRKLYGGFLLVRKDILDAAGWFDERYFMYAEDADLSRTILGLGWKLYYYSESVVVHSGGGLTADAPATFSCLMMQESINKLIHKYQGSVAAYLHRFVVLAGGLLRLGAVLLARLMTSWRSDETSRAGWRAAWVKHQQLVLWSLGLRKAAVPVSPSTKCP